MIAASSFISVPNSRDLRLSPMGCGTWAWGNRLLWGYDTRMNDDLRQVFNLCVGRGVTLFDTGDSYGTGRLNGQSEKLLGHFSQDYVQGEAAINAEQICLATKLAPYPWRFTRQSMVRACRASSERLQRPIDLAQLHWSTANYWPWQELPLLEGLMDLYEQGHIRGIGVSNFGAKRLRRIHQRFAERGLAIATLQVQYSLLSTAPLVKLGIKDVCDELGIQLIAYSPLALGILTGKYNSKNLPSGLRGLVFRQILPGVQGLLGCLEAIAKERQKTCAQVALNWCMCKGTIPIPGAKNADQAEQNIGALGWQLHDGEISELDREAANTDKQMVQNIFQTR